MATIPVFYQGTSPDTEVALPPHAVVPDVGEFTGGIHFDRDVAAGELVPANTGALLESSLGVEILEVLTGGNVLYSYSFYSGGVEHATATAALSGSPAPTGPISAALPPPSYIGSLTQPTDIDGLDATYGWAGTGFSGGQYTPGAYGQLKAPRLYSTFQTLLDGDGTYRHQFVANYRTYRTVATYNPASSPARTWNPTPLQIEWEIDGVVTQCEMVDISTTASAPGGSGYINPDIDYYDNGNGIWQWAPQPDIGAWNGTSPIVVWDDPAQPMPVVRVSAIDEYGRRSRWMRLFLSPAPTTPPRAPRARFIVRYVSGQIITRPGHILWQHEGLGRIWSGNLTTGAVDYSDDEGTTWINMANPWEDVEGAVPLDFEELPHGACCAIARVSGHIKFRRSPDGATWGPLQEVAPAGDGNSAWCVRSHATVGLTTITIREDSGSARYDTQDDGKETTWQPTS